MKKIITTVALSLFAASFCIAQDNVTVKMNVKVEGLPPEYAGFGEQEIVNYIKGDKHKSEMSSMMGSNITVFDGKKLTALNEQMGNKSGYTATKEEIEADNKSKEKDPKPKVEYTTEKKTIAGYECTKAIITSVGKDKKESKMTVWVTDKIKTPETGKSGKSRGGMMDLGDLKGYPLEMEMSQSQQGMDMKILVTTSEVSTANIDDSIFNVSTEGYKMRSYAEQKAEMKKMEAEAKGGK
ncbi:MAG: DUF4412 domain-containing protein [Bacteroidetes bacterium]|nr:DUF4412 domain-containing protein [Bacteroidota bacterium]